MKRIYFNKVWIATALFLCMVGCTLVSAEITDPQDVDPGTETPTNEGLNVKITNFDMDMSSTETTYEYTITATGTASADVVKGYYSIWVYGSNPGEAGPQQNWEGSPIDEEHSYGSHVYKEEFFGTGPDGSWSTWKWYFHSEGPIDDSNRDRFEDPESYWGPIDHLLLWIRGYEEGGTWDQDSMDITEEYTGITSTTGDDDTSDDDTSDDDTSDDDTSDDDTSDDDTEDGDGEDDSPGFELGLIAISVFIAVIFIIRRKRN